MTCGFDSESERQGVSGCHLFMDRVAVADITQEQVHQARAWSFHGLSECATLPIPPNDHQPRGSQTSPWVFMNALLHDMFD